MGKDGNLRLWDPRTPGDQAVAIEGLAAKKVAKAFWCGNLNFVGTIGQDKSSKRVIKIWDLSNTSKPVTTMKPGSGSSTSSVAMPHYDPDVNILYFYGKGESQVWFGE